MNSKSRYELAASVCRGKVWLDNTALAAISRMYRKRIENATSKLEATVEQGRYASFRIDQALDHPKASRLVLQQMIASLEEVILKQVAASIRTVIPVLSHNSGKNRL